MSVLVYILTVDSKLTKHGKDQFEVLETSSNINCSQQGSFRPACCCLTETLNAAWVDPGGGHVNLRAMAYIFKL